jgi:hypothetical protein
MLHGFIADLLSVAQEDVVRFEVEVRDAVHLRGRIHTSMCMCMCMCLCMCTCICVSVHL